MAGFVGPDSGLQKRQKQNIGDKRVSERHTLLCMGERTMVICAVFPECLPFPEIERHAALGVDYHG
jgi:hypothetical protein